MTPPRCRGLLGLIFGHKFVKTVGDYTFHDGYCYRCGITPVPVDAEITFTP